MKDHEYPADVAARYGVQVHDTLTVGETRALRESVDHGRTVYWSDPTLRKILRFRIIGACREFPFWDVSYCYGELEDGSRVLVTLPFHQLPQRGWRGKVIEYAKRDNVFAKGLGIFDADVLSTLNG